MKKLLQDRKTLYLALGIAVVSVFTLSIAYAAMSTVLEIHGNSEVVASSWDIHLDNVEVKSGSVSANAPVISGTSSLSFDVDLNLPGDYYEFTVDVVNEGSIDAMIDSVVKTPELTSEQAKYIKYEITYENGESISTKQTLQNGTTTPIKVRVEYRKDLVASDLPSGTTELSLKLTLIYVQSDGSISTKPPTKHPSSGTDAVVTVLSGDGTQVGNEVCIKEECFYVISSTDSTVTMLSKMNITLDDTPNQSLDAGTTAFSSDSQKGQYYSYYSGSIVEKYVNDYNDYLIEQGVIPIEARIMNKVELENLGCNVPGSCSSAPSWVYATSYWIDYSANPEDVLYVNYNNNSFAKYSIDSMYGVRPVITISRDLI